MSTTTVTTGSPPDAVPGELTVRQQVSRPSVAQAVQQRVRELHRRGEHPLTPAHFDDLAREFHRPVSWITDQLLVLEGFGVLRQDPHAAGRVWTVNAGSEYLQ